MEAREKRAHRYLKSFLLELRNYRASALDALRAKGHEDPTLTDATILAIILKGCFLKLADEKQFLSISRRSVFQDLMKLRRRAPKASSQLDLWQSNHVALAVDGLLEDLDTDPAVLASARIGALYRLLQGVRLEWLGEDLLGTVYQELTRPGARKTHGQYYTPPEVVAAILDGVPMDPLSERRLRVLDPACGSGQFLLGAYDRLKARLLETGLPAGEAHRRVIERHLYGFDIDPFALTLTKMNLFLKERIAEPIRFNIHLVNPLERDEMELFSSVCQTGESAGAFDAVIGNPPWGSKLSKREREEYRRSYRVGKSGLNSFTLFLERALELARPGGRVGFLIPDALLNIKTHQAARALLLERSALERIATCGELFDRVFAPSMILICRREADEQLRLAARVRIRRNLGSPNASGERIGQEEFHRTPENIFNIHLDESARRLLSKIMAQAAGLKGNARFGLGLVTGDNERLIAKGPVTERHEPLIVGRDISPYRIAFSGHYIVYDRDALQQACPREIFDAPRKLVYRFIGKRLVFALDDLGRFTLNNANVLVPQLAGFRMKYVLALLNSPVLQYYYTFSFFTLKVLRGNLERLPLRWTDDARQRRIQTMVDELRFLHGAEFTAMRKRIDEEIFDIYGIEEEERTEILSRLAEEIGESEIEPVPAPHAPLSERRLS